MRKPYWLVLVCAWCSSGEAAEPKAEIPRLQWPTIEPVKLGRGFGKPTAETPGRVHSGLDISAPKGSPVFAAEKGVVRSVTDTYLKAEEAGRYAGARTAIVIEHVDKAGRRYVTSYGHVEPADFIRKGLRAGKTVEVRRGQEIAKIADWGGNTHLHFGVKNLPFDVDPWTAAGGRVRLDQLGRYEDPLKHMDQDLVRDVSKKVSEAFGRKPPPDPSTDPKKEPRAGQNKKPDAAEDLKGTAATMGPFRYVIPEGWGVSESHDGDGITLRKDGAKRNPYITFFLYPRLGPSVPYTPDAISRHIVRISWSVGGRPVTRGTIDVGQAKYRGVWMKGSGDFTLEGTLFTHGGHVYTLFAGYEPEDIKTPVVYRKIIRSIEPKR